MENTTNALQLYVSLYMICDEKIVFDPLFPCTLLKCSFSWPCVALPSLLDQYDPEAEMSLQLRAAGSGMLAQMAWA